MAKKKKKAKLRPATLPVMVGSGSAFQDAWLYGAARAFFVSAYIEYVEDDERKIVDKHDYPRPKGGEDWMDFAPEAPFAAYALAGELWAELQALNGACGVYTLAERAEAADGEPPDPQIFGHYLAMQSMGHGVSWFDDHAEFEINVPHGECSMFTFGLDAYRAE